MIPTLKKNPIREMESKNLVHEESLTYYPEKTREPLVTELWAIRSIGNKMRAEQMASRARLPLIWMDKIPGEHYRFFNLRCANREKSCEKMKKVLNICFGHPYSKMKSHHKWRVVIWNGYLQRHSAGEHLGLMN